MLYMKAAEITNEELISYIGSCAYHGLVHHLHDSEDKVYHRDYPKPHIKPLVDSMNVLAKLYHMMKYSNI